MRFLLGVLAGSLFLAASASALNNLVYYDPFDVSFNADSIANATSSGVFGGADTAYGNATSLKGRAPFSRNPLPGYAGGPVSPPAVNLIGSVWQTGNNTLRQFSEGSGHDFDRDWVLIRTQPGSGTWNADAPPVGRPGIWGALDAWAAVSLGTNGSWTKPTAFELRSNMNPNSATQNSVFHGHGLGYWSALPNSTQTATTNFTGFMLRNDGRLQLLVNGTANTTHFATVSGPIVYTWPELRFTIDTVTGNVTELQLLPAPGQGNLTLTGLSGLLAAAAGAFTDARTAFAGTSSVVGAPTGEFGNFPKGDNFAILIPEPSVSLCLLAALLGAGLRRRRTAPGQASPP